MKIAYYPWRFWYSGKLSGLIDGKTAFRHWFIIYRIDIIPNWGFHNVKLNFGIENIYLAFLRHVLIHLICLEYFCAKKGLILLILLRFVVLYVSLLKFGIFDHKLFNLLCLRRILFIDPLFLLLWSILPIVRVYHKCVYIFRGFTLKLHAPKISIIFSPILLFVLFLFPSLIFPGEVHQFFNESFSWLHFELFLLWTNRKSLREQFLRRSVLCDLKQTLRYIIRVLYRKIIII